MRKILFLSLTFFLGATSLAKVAQADAAANAAEERRKLEVAQNTVDRLTRDYNRHCFKEGLDRVAAELQTKNQITAQGSWWNAAIERAKLRIKCKTDGPRSEIFMCQAQAICEEKREDIKQARGELAAQSARELAARQAVPTPTEPTATHVKDLPIAAPPARLGERPVTHPSSLSACGVPSTIEISGSPSDAVLRYRRGRMFKQVLYDACVAQAVSDQDRQACALVVKPMAMSDLRANGAYLKTRPAAMAFYECLKTEAGATPAESALPAAEGRCMRGQDKLRLQQATYLGDLPDCRLAAATADASLTAPAPPKDPGTPEALGPPRSPAAGAAH